jgi:hypothetical protein
MVGETAGGEVILAIGIVVKDNGEWAVAYGHVHAGVEFNAVRHGNANVFDETDIVEGLGILGCHANDPEIYALLARKGSAGRDDKRDFAKQQLGFWG